jgi:hypothetical protein
MGHILTNKRMRHAGLAFALLLISSSLPAMAAEQAPSVRSIDGRTAPQMTAAMKQTLSRVNASVPSTRRSEWSGDSGRTSQVNSAIAAAARASRAARAAACN